MVSKLLGSVGMLRSSFRAVLFRMVSKPSNKSSGWLVCFRAVLFRMVSKLVQVLRVLVSSFRAVLFRMVSKQYS